MTKTGIKADIIIDLIFKKLIADNIILILTGKISTSKALPFKRILCIYYPIYFKKNQAKI